MKETAGTRPEFVVVGVLSKPHGIRGELKVYSYAERPESFQEYARLLLSPDQGEHQTAYEVERARVLGRQVILKLKGCDDRNTAETLVGQTLWVGNEELPPLEAGEFYLYELEGKEAVSEDGRHLGQVRRVLTSDTQDLLAIDHQGKEVLVPLVAAFLVSHDATRVVLRLPPGLLEINS